MNGGTCCWPPGGLQPDVGHEVLWVLRDVLSGEVLLARALLGSGEEQLVPLFQDVQITLDVTAQGYSGSTPYVRLGNWPFIVFCFGVLGFLFFKNFHHRGTEKTLNT